MISVFVVSCAQLVAHIRVQQVAHNPYGVGILDLRVGVGKRRKCDLHCNQDDCRERRAKVLVGKY
ncbi:hypothetical protein PSEUDO8AS_10354 [Pseudomonas sp. 8AS]|nr:hypothetical protein PSEUDO8AS_10354 [Pseudomonas sp. 8AS]